jgi:hypothetical protein
MPLVVKWELSNQFVVLCMGADPEPDDSIRNSHSNCSVMEPNTGGPKAAHFLEV